MAETAFQKQFRQEMIAGFEVNQSLLRDATVTETVIKGNEAEFLVVDSGGATAVTRGVNGEIPARGDNNTQTTCTLTEWHDLAKKTRFNIFASQGNQRQVMQRTTMAVINRKIDSDILTALNTATVNTGSATTASLSMVLSAQTTLQNADVPWDMNIMGVVSPAFHGYLLQIAAYASADYVDLKELSGGGNQWSDRMKARRWLDINWIVHPAVPGVGTAAEKCFLFHRNAIGHATDTERLDTAIGYNDEQDYSYARCSTFMGSKLLQNSGVVVMNHDGSALSL